MAESNGLKSAAADGLQVAPVSPKATGEVEAVHHDDAGEEMVPQKAGASTDRPGSKPANPLPIRALKAIASVGQGPSAWGGWRSRG